MTQPSPSPSSSSGGTWPEHALSSPSQSSVAPGYTVAVLSSQSPPLIPSSPTQPVQATKPSPSSSVSPTCRTSESQLLITPSQTSVLPGYRSGLASSQSSSVAAKPSGWSQDCWVSPRSPNPSPSLSTYQTWSQSEVLSPGMQPATSSKTVMILVNCPPSERWKWTAKQTSSLIAISCSCKTDRAVPARDSLA